MVWGLFVNAVKILAGREGLCSTMYDTLWVRNTFIQKLLFRTFSELSVGSGPRDSERIKPAPALKMFGVLWSLPRDKADCLPMKNELEASLGTEGA